mmetsp:Transcript_22538/g.29493  ORF Transcript_22538/g.29493 Transcript_22538/m.29493 type:complete len:559 (+) Transcript_22538:73-1749(+)
MGDKIASFFRPLQRMLSGVDEDERKEDFTEEGQVTVPEGGVLHFQGISGYANTVDEKKNKYTVFFLEMACEGANPPSWRVYRRYSDFGKVHDHLKNQGVSGVPALPKKKFLGIGQLDKDFIEKRQGELEVWVQQVLPLITFSPPPAPGENVMPPPPPGAKAQATVIFQDDVIIQEFFIREANLPPPKLEEPETTIADQQELDRSAAADMEGSTPTRIEEMCEEQRVNMSDFELIRVIGKGSFGKVTLVKKKGTDEHYAMKVLTKSHVKQRRQVEHTRTERRVMGQIRHPFVVALHYAFQTRDKLYFVLDYCPGGELFFHLTRMKRLPEHMARFYSAEIALALEHLHSNNVIYRDLKPENILLDELGHVKLADFGLAKENVEDEAKGATSLCGTPEYLSPEILERKGHGTAVDWWALGMVTYEMLTGLPPWYTTDRKELFQRLRGAQLSFPFYISRQTAHLISGLLARNPVERFGAAEIKSHPFFSSIDWDALYRREINPPFNPCRDHDILDTKNFEKQFTQLPLGNEESSKKPTAVVSETFKEFTFHKENVMRGATRK